MRLGKDMGWNRQFSRKSNWNHWERKQVIQSCEKAKWKIQEVVPRKMTKESKTRKAACPMAVWFT